MGGSGACAAPWHTLQQAVSDEKAPEKTGLVRDSVLQGLRQRIRDSYEARWKAEKHFDEDEIMQELPNSLRTEV